MSPVAVAAAIGAIDCCLPDSACAAAGLPRAATMRNAEANARAIFLRGLACGVLVIADFLHPGHVLAIGGARDREVRHRCARRSTMPVLDAGRAPHHVTGADG